LTILGLSIFSFGRNGKLVHVRNVNWRHKWLNFDKKKDLEEIVVKLHLFPQSFTRPSLSYENYKFQELIFLSTTAQIATILNGFCESVLATSPQSTMQKSKLKHRSWWINLFIWLKHRARVKKKSKKLVQQNRLK
jgi:hypothetical protein